MDFVTRMLVHDATPAEHRQRYAERAINAGKPELAPCGSKRKAASSSKAVHQHNKSSPGPDMHACPTAQSPLERSRQAAVGAARDRTDDADPKARFRTMRSKVFQPAAACADEAENVQMQKAGASSKAAPAQPGQPAPQPLHKPAWPEPCASAPVSEPAQEAQPSHQASPQHAQDATKENGTCSAALVESLTFAPCGAQGSAKTASLTALARASSVPHNGLQTPEHTGTNLLSQQPSVASGTIKNTTGSLSSELPSMPDPEQDAFPTPVPFQGFEACKAGHAAAGEQRAPVQLSGWPAMAPAATAPVQPARMPSVSPPTSNQAPSALQVSPSPVPDTPQSQTPPPVGPVSSLAHLAEPVTVQHAWPPLQQEQEQETQQKGQQQPLTQEARKPEGTTACCRRQHCTGRCSRYAW